MVDLSLKAYEMQTSKQLSNTDGERKLRFCQQINGLFEEERLDVNTIIFSDESHIYSNVTLIAKNYGVHI